MAERDVPRPRTAATRRLAHASCRAEWDRPTDVLIHSPGPEFAAGLSCPLTALFEGVFDPRKAAREHAAFVEAIRRRGVRVHRLRDLLIEGTRGRDGESLEGEALDDLRGLARTSLTYDASGLAPDEQADLGRYREETILRLSPDELFRLVILRPTHRFRRSVIPNAPYASDVRIEALMNLVFQRDQMITTARGIVLGRLNSEQRRHEAAVTRLALKRLGLEPIYEVSGPAAFLEGGDFFPCGDYCLVGEGLRTTREGIDELLENLAFGCPEVAVIKDPWRDQEQMHLDTYFNFCGPDLAAMVEGRIRDPQLAPKADVYRLRGGRYTRVRGDVPFVAYLRDKGVRVIPISKAEQLRYGVNFLCLGDRRLIGVGGQDGSYRDRFTERDVAARWIDMPNLTKAYGAIHCCTQVLRREPLGTEEAR